MKKQLFRIISILMFAIAASGCSDELEYTPACPAGESATLRLQLQVADVAVNSRATDTGISNLWVGIYNVATGECTFNKVFEQSADQPEHTQLELPEIACKSGRSYVVAVANIDVEHGLYLNDNKEQPLRELLLNADSWDKYQLIAIEGHTTASDETMDVSAVSTEMLMSGSYMTTHRQGAAADVKETLDIQPGANTPSGAIHLRRIWAQNTLNISATGNIASIELTEVEILNVPRYSWLDSRDGSDGSSVAASTVNAGDYANPGGTGVDNAMYPASLSFTPPAEIIYDTKTETYSFTWWQFENKRTGTATAYQERELRHKGADGSDTRVFRSLAESAAGSLDNNATYVRIEAKVTYTDPGNNLDNPSGLDLPQSSASRTAQVTYYVHLGYMGGDPSDFNCHRNSRNTYNIRVRSVNDILLEAFTDQENQPGAEGTVTDVTEKIETLDAHSGMFNIYLTTNEISNFNFTMRTYDSGAPVMIYADSDGEGNIPAEGSADFVYYNWIELVPTGITSTDTKYESSFAAYPDLTKYSRQGRVYYAGEVSKSGLKGQWFTVYVNEYTYEKRYGESGYGNETGTDWKRYVNQPNRAAWFNVAQEISSDNNSIYYRAKYALEQKAIQTYYNTASDDCTTALGLEHDNESFGQNIRYTLSKGAAPDNGRYNCWNAVSAAPMWSKYVSLTSQQQISAITESKQSVAAGLERSARTWPVAAQVLLNGGLNGTAGSYNGSSGSQDPQNGSNPQYIEALYACLNRNRDENGNGVIEQEEMKWYLPASGKYLRMILGRNSLLTPLMNFQQATLPSGCGDDGNNLYHYISSDAKIIWVDEGMSSSEFINPDVSWAHAPWQLRCIRNLGTDLRTKPTVDEVEQVEPAYVSEVSSSNDGGAVVKVRRYYGTALRKPSTSPLPMHKVSSSNNKLSLYGFEVAPAGNTFDSDGYEATSQLINTESKTITEISSISYADYSQANLDNYYCGKLNASSTRKGWRLPNQKEIVIMLRLKLAKGSTRCYEFDKSGNLVEKNPVSTSCFMTCTQEQWTNSGNQPGNSAEGLSWNYRLTTIQSDQNIAVAVVNSTGRVRSARCVRDLTEEELNMSYDKLISQ